MSVRWKWEEMLSKGPLWLCPTWVKFGQFWWFSATVRCAAAMEVSRTPKTQKILRSALSSMQTFLYCCVFYKTNAKTANPSYYPLIQEVAKEIIN